MCPAARQRGRQLNHCQEHSWIEGLLLPSAGLLSLVSVSFLAGFCDVCWLIVELLYVIPEIVRLTTL